MSVEFGAFFIARIFAYKMAKKLTSIEKLSSKRY
jgi:hypothetical protein